MRPSELHGRTLLVATFEGGTAAGAQYRFLRGRGHSQANGFLVLGERNEATLVPEACLAGARHLTEQLQRLLRQFLTDEMLVGVEYFVGNPPRDEAEDEEGYTIYAPHKSKLDDQTR